MPSTHQVLVAIVVLLSLRHVDTQDNHVIVSGDVIFAAMFSVTNVENGVCGTYDVETLQSIVAVTWFLEALNRMDYIPGITLGLDVYRTCKMPERATEGAIRLMTKYGVVTDDSTPSNNQSVLFGLLGPERTSEALAVSRMVSSLPAHQRLLQVSGSSTGQQLSDATRHPNFFRVIPPDETQVRVILELLIQLQWNYIAIVYEDDDYGRPAATELRQLAEGRQLCVPVFASLPIDIKSSKFAIKAKEIANELKSSKNGLVRGVVILGGTSTTRDLLETLSQYVSYVTLILSEAVALQRSTLLTVTGQVSDLARGAMVTTPRYLPMEEVRVVWNQLWNNYTVFDDHARVNPWLGGYFAQVAGCSYDTSSCWERASSSRASQMAAEGRELSLYISYQVSGASTSVTLSDTIRFPYFLRLPAPDNKQALALLDIVHTLGANYIQVIYDGSATYASGLFQELENNIQHNNKYNICIAQSIVTTPHTDLTQYLWMKTKLRQATDARIVIIILHHVQVAKVMQAILPDLNPQEFMFIATESWGRRQDFITGANRIKLAGSLVLSQEIVIDPFFQQYFQNLHPEASNKNPWLAYFWEAKLNCYFNKSFRRHGKSGPCPDNFAQGYIQEIRVPFYIQALYALVLGFSQTLSRVCGPHATGVCRALTSAALFEDMLKVKLDLYGTGQPSRLFDSKGDGLVGYKVLQIERDDSASAPDVLRYGHVGSWTLNKLTLEEDRLTLTRKSGFVSRCPNSHVQCSICFSANRSQIREDCVGGEMSVAAFASVVVILLLIIAVLVVVVVLIYRLHKVMQTAQAQKLTASQMNQFKFHSYHTEDSAPEPQYSSIDNQATRPPRSPPARCPSTNGTDNYLHAVPGPDDIQAQGT